MAFYSKWDNGERAKFVGLCIAVVIVFGLSIWGFERAFHKMRKEDELVTLEEFGESVDKQRGLI
jgi:hypothetical protein